MDSRRLLAHRVLEEGWPVASAAREAGVSRQSAHAWVARAREEGIEKMQERSRRPLRSPRKTDEQIASQILRAAEANPHWGPLTLHALLWPAGDAPVCARTVGRVLARAGRRVVPANPPKALPVRFERDHPNELWQVDFKRLGPRGGRRESFNAVDDASRYVLASRLVPDQTLASAWSVLWDAFAEFGLPQAVLADNGPAFRASGTWRWSAFDLRLMLLGIRPAHGRPYHPETQGKVERFHGTLHREFDAALLEREDPQQELGAFRNRYNWARPHQALAFATPGSRYRPSSRIRPARMPAPFFPPGAQIRKCQDQGILSFQGQCYKLGRAFEKLPVGILEGENGILNLVWADFTLAPLQDLKVSRMSCPKRQECPVT